MVVRNDQYGNRNLIADNNVEIDQGPNQSLIIQCNRSCANEQKTSRQYRETGSISGSITVHYKDITTKAKKKERKNERKKERKKAKKKERKKAKKKERKKLFLLNY